MSAPARALPAPRSTEPAAPRARQPAARPKPVPPPQRRARRGSTPAFWFLAASVVSVLVFTVVALNAMVVNTTYRTDDAQDRLRALEETHEELEVEVARLSSPSRIAAWADAVGMVAPEPGGSVILRVPGERSAGPGADGP